MIAIGADPRPVDATELMQINLASRSASPRLL